MREKFLAKSENACLFDVVLLFIFDIMALVYFVIIIYKYRVRMNKKNMSY